MTRLLVDRPSRVPFVRSCLVVPVGGRPFRAITANLSVLGCYVASGESLEVGRSLSMRFTVPGNALESEVAGTVAWLNSTQAHAVYSLPPGFGVRFHGLDAGTRRRIDEVVGEYHARHRGRGDS